MKSLVRCFLLTVVCIAFALAIRKERCALIKSQAGECMASFRRWSFDLAKNTCVFFVYGGCGGNANRFESEDECLKTCKDEII